MTIQIALLFLALICFLLGSVGFAPASQVRPNWMSLGLAFWVLSLIIGRG